MSKLGFVVGIAAGYVLGARAGRERYEQIKQIAGQAWNHPAVADQRTRTAEQIKQRGPEVAAAAGQAAIKGAGQAAKSAVTAGFQAAVGNKPGPVVPGTLAEGASYDQDERSADAADESLSKAAEATR
ncbi:YtxH domain-containing protein [Flexivirga meconopsidis]|uniref:YtxH domain-containing protein n=1 Tax=Flexivirga meconopsidis TaxID=2977121 RepID=UPI00223EA700|nr:YtxH domain-containing protein [Flexivirga meconopsidis]